MGFGGVWYNMEENIWASVRREILVYSVSARTIVLGEVPGSNSFPGIVYLNSPISKWWKNISSREPHFPSTSSKIPNSLELKSIVKYSERKLPSEEILLMVLLQWLKRERSVGWCTTIRDENEFVQYRSIEFSQNTKHIGMPHTQKCIQNCGWCTYTCPDF